jgi:hypothetical protein
MRNSISGIYPLSIWFESLRISAAILGSSRSKTGSDASKRISSNVKMRLPPLDGSLLVQTSSMICKHFGSSDFLGSGRTEPGSSPDAGG